MISYNTLLLTKREVNDSRKIKRWRINRWNAKEISVYDAKIWNNERITRSTIFPISSRKQKIRSSKKC
jgi:hypothetical protein